MSNVTYSRRCQDYYCDTIIESTLWTGILLKNCYLGSQETHSFMESGSLPLCSHDSINGPFFEAFKLILFLSHLF